MVSQEKNRDTKKPMSPGGGIPSTLARKIVQRTQAWVKAGRPVLR